MKLIYIIIAATMCATSAIAEQTVTLIWPNNAREGDRYVAEMIDTQSTAAGQFVIDVSPNDVSVLPVGDASKICFFATRGARPLSALRGTYLGNPIALVPAPATGKICLSLFDNKSTEWRTSI